MDNQIVTSDATSDVSTVAPVVATPIIETPVKTRKPRVARTPVAPTLTDAETAKLRKLAKLDAAAAKLRSELPAATVKNHAAEQAEIDTIRLGAESFATILTALRRGQVKLLPPTIAALITAVKRIPDASIAQVVRYQSETGTVTLHGGTRGGSRGGANGGNSDTKVTREKLRALGVTAMRCGNVMRTLFDPTTGEWTHGAAADIILASARASGQTAKTAMGTAGSKRITITAKTVAADVYRPESSVRVMALNPTLNGRIDVRIGTKWIKITTLGAKLGI